MYKKANDVAAGSPEKVKNDPETSSCSSLFVPRPETRYSRFLSFFTSERTGKYLTSRVTDRLDNKMCLRSRRLCCVNSHPETSNVKSLVALNLSHDFSASIEW